MFIENKKSSQQSMKAKASFPATEVDVENRIDNSTHFSKSQAEISETDLEKKYPKLNLNEDISKLDGVPAIRLTDGSVLHIDEIIEISKDLKK